MSADTIPSEVVRTLTHETVCGYKVAAYRETHPEHGAAYGHTYSEHWSTPNSRHPSVTVERLFTEAQLRDALTDRSTRPAEPAAPVAEAGDGDVSRYIAKCREMSKGENGHTYTWWSRLADLLSTLEAERARADAAEQRAADALARAEKAEGALETAQSHLTAIFGIETHSLHVGYDEGSGGGNFVYAEVIRTDDLAFIAARASRETQPATDGGDNG